MQPTILAIPTKIQIIGTSSEYYREVLTPAALEFLGALHRNFNTRRKEILVKRAAVQERMDAGELPIFKSYTRPIRESEWTVAPIPADLLDRRVEITGPVERKMIINALNSGAKVFMADFEDSNTPTWENTIEGQINLRDAIRRTISYTAANGKHYELNEKTAVLMVRPRGWHLEDQHILVDGERMSGALLDFGLYFFHNAKELIARGTAPYFYLPKLESYKEARLWNDVFVFAQANLGIPHGTIRATVLIETILAAFQMHEILWELRDHSAGLNCGRWDYIFSFIKKFSHRSDMILPDRALVTMAVPMMAAYSELVIKTCHRRGIHAIGGMAAQIPVKNDEAANKEAFDKIFLDKKREAENGHDGTWVAHPGLVKLAMDTFNEIMPKPNQIDKLRDDVCVSAGDLLAIPKGDITEAGVRENINVGILYMESWLRGVGAAAIYHKMEDAATAEISRAQLWQWIRHSARMKDGRTVTLELYKTFLPEELLKIKAYVGENAYETGRFMEAVELFNQLIESPKFIDFLTLPAYEKIV
jgi:malate synthase